MKISSSKIGLELLIPLGILFAFLLYLVIAQSNWMGVFIMVATICFVVYLFISTRYIIKGKTLEVKFGFFYDERIDIEKIKTIKEVTDFFAAPATTFKRLEITYNRSGTIAISPKDKMQFIQVLTQLNPKIEIPPPSDN